MFALASNSYFQIAVGAGFLHRWVVFGRTTGFTAAKGEV
jgi:hypothetical protein